MKTALHLILFVSAIFATSAVHADTPLRPPAIHKVSSHNHAFTVISSPEKGTWVLNNATNQKLWSMTDWYRWIFVSNDGDYLVTGYNGLNLIPSSYTDDLVLFTFWKRGKEIRKVTLKEIVPDKSILLRTASHYLWGTIIGINDKNELLVKRIDEKIFLFDVSTGIRK